MRVIREDVCKGWVLVEFEGRDDGWYNVYPRSTNDTTLFTAVVPFARFEKTPRGWRAGQTLIRSLI